MGRTGRAGCSSRVDGLPLSGSDHFILADEIALPAGRGIVEDRTAFPDPYAVGLDTIASRTEQAAVRR
ncbi:hypothetical protein GCM10010388_72510 [Streptomyces mauvecolor]